MEQPDFSEQTAHQARRYLRWVERKFPNRSPDDLPSVVKDNIRAARIAIEYFRLDKAIDSSAATTNEKVKI